MEIKNTERRSLNVGDVATKDVLESGLNNRERKWVITRKLQQLKG